MAIQVLPARGSFGQTIGQALGTGLGTGIGGALENLAQMQLQDVVSRRQAQNQLPFLKQMFPEKEEAELLSFAQAPQHLQKQYLENVQKQRQAEIFSQLEGARLGEPSGLSALAQFAPTTGGYVSPTQMMAPEQAQQLLQQPARQQIQPSMMSPSEVRRKALASGLDLKQADLLARRAEADIKRAQDVSFKERELGLKEKGVSQRQIAEAFKLTKDTRKEILTGGRGAREDLRKLNRMEELNKKGTLQTGLFNSVLNKLGFDIPSLMNPDSQEFQKLSVDFLRNAKSVFGARISNFEADKFLQSIPSLAQTPEGRQRVIDNLKIVANGNLVREQALRDILKENAGVPPLDLEEKIQERADEILDTSAIQFKSNTDPKLLDELHEVAGTMAAEPQGPITGQPQLTGEPPSGLPAETGTVQTIADIGKETAITAGEALLGLPGDILSTIYGVPKWALGKAGIKLPEYEALQKFWPSLFTGTTGQIRDLVSEAREAVTGKKPVPATKMGELYKDIVTDIVQLTVPFAGKIPFKAALAKAIGGNMAALATREVGGGPLLEGGVKLGTMIALGAKGGRKQFADHVENQYKATEALSEGARTTVKPLEKELKQVEKYAYLGLETADKKKMKDVVKNLDQKINIGEIAVEDALASEKDINKFIRESESKEARKMLGTLKEGLTQTIENYGKKNPEFLKSYKSAKEGYRALNNAGIVQQTLNSLLAKENLLKHATTKALFGGAALYKFGTIGTLGAIGAGAGIREGLKAFTLLKNPEARKLYTEIIANAAAKDLMAAERNMRKLDKIAGKYEEKLPKD